MNTFPQKFRFSFVRDGVTTYCKYAPEEWNDNVLKWERDKKSHAIMTKYVNTFSFVLEDATYLRNCFDAVDFQDRIFPEILFIVEEYDYSTFTYTPYYSANVDFYSYEETLNSVKVSTLDIGYKVAFDANYDTTYEIDIPASADQVEYDRLQMKNIIRVESAFSEKISSTLNGTAKIIGIDIIIEETVNNCFESEYPGSSLFGDGQWFLKATKKATLNIGGNYSVRANFTAQANRARIEFKIIRKNGDQTNTYSLGYTEISPAFPGMMGVFFPQSINIEADDMLYLAFDSEFVHTGLDKGSIEIKVNLDMDYYAKDRTVKIQGLRPVQLLASLVSKATDNKYTAISSPVLTAGDISDMLITSGDLVRGISGAKIKTSLKDFFESMQAMFGLYYTFDKTGHQEALVIKHINDFYDKNRCLTSLSDIKDFKRGVYNDQVYNRLIIGYKDNTYDQINGKYEFNTQLEYSIPTDAKTKELKLVSPYRADMYGIEFLIMDYDKKDTTDSDSDSDVFIFHTGDKTEENGGASIYKLNRTEKIPGHLAGETAFNTFLSPRHCLIRQIGYIKSLFMYSGNSLKFASSPKEYNMPGNNGTKEHDDISLNSYKELFRPVQYEFETMVPGGISELMEQSNSGYVEIDTGRGTVKGFILSAGENPGRNKSQTWKLLALE